MSHKEAFERFQALVEAQAGIADVKSDLVLLRADIEALLAARDQALADAAALKQLGLRLVGTLQVVQHDGAALQDSTMSAISAAVLDWYDVVNIAPRPGAALLMQLTRGEGVAVAGAIVIHELERDGEIQPHTRNLLVAAVNAFEAGKATL